MMDMLKMKLWEVERTWKKKDGDKLNINLN